MCAGFAPTITPSEGGLVIAEAPAAYPRCPAHSFLRRTNVLATDPVPFYWLPPRRVEQPSPFHWLKFRLDGHVLDPAALPAIGLPQELDPYRHLGLMLSGKGPLWLYGHLVHLAHVFAWVAVYDPRLSGGVVVMRHTARAPQLGEIIPFAEDTDAAPPGLSAVPVPGGHMPPELRWSGTEGAPSAESVTLHLTPPGGGRVFQPSDLPVVALPPDQPTGTALVRLSGPFPIWLLTHLVGRLHGVFPDASLAMYDPKLAGAVVVAGRGGLLPGLVIPDRPRAAVPIVGLIGDPNSGKSVLSWKLYHALQARGRAVYRLDCDAYAPTAGWSLGSATGRRLRGAYKRERGEWRQEDVEGLAAAVRQIRRSALHLGLLDMPGGLHQGVPEPVRVPAGREELFALADAFVLLQRNDEAAAGWRQALGDHGLAGRIVACVCPCPDRTAPEVCHPRLGSREEVPTWTIHALDRELIGERTPGVEALADYLLVRLGVPPA
jgi:CRISPR-associated protein Csx3